MSDQADEADLFRSLHVPGTPLVLPNAWDAGSARAIATALGYDDGERAPIAATVNCGPTG